jgi:putative intracellular protease/amidase
MTATTVHMAIYDGLADWEVGLTTAHINNGLWQREPGRLRVVTVGETDEPVATMGGARIVPDVTLAELQPQDSAMLILPGGDTWDAGGSTAFVRKAQDFLETGVPVAAICGATAGLAAGGVLDDRRHTSNAREYLAATGYGGGDLYVDELAVTDGILVTAGSMAPAEFAREVLALLDLYEPHVLASWYKVFGQQDPAGFFELMSSAA